MLSDIIEKYSRNECKVVFLNVFESPMGKMVSAADDYCLNFLLFADSRNLGKQLQTLVKEINCTYIEEKNELYKRFEIELNQYFEGHLKKFTTPIKMSGTHFQKEVWSKLMNVPYGATSTYGDLARALGRTQSHARAIGGACRANAHLLLIPCHRIVALGSKGGFSSGLQRKEWLLKHEKKFT